jgi:hypothetical protein
VKNKKFHKMEQQAQPKKKRTWLWVVGGLLVLGYALGDKDENGNGSHAATSKCVVCGEYSTTSNSMNFELHYSDPEVLDNGNVRGKVYFGVNSPVGAFFFKGSFAHDPSVGEHDGMIRLEYRRNGSTDAWEQISYENTDNVMFYKIREAGGLIVQNGNCTEFPLASISELLFFKMK